MPISFTELLAKQNQIMGQVVSRAAHTMQADLEKAAQQVADTIDGAVVIKPPGPKSLKRARQKVNGKYGGDWFEIKDMARVTIVVESPVLLDVAINAVRTRFRISKGFSLIEEKITNAHENAAGYSGMSVIVSAGGNIGEIQINTPNLMYAKSLPEFSEAMPHRVTQMKASFPMVPGGLGHMLYEVFRDEKQPAAVQKIYGNASRHYYNYFRSFPISLHRGLMAWEAVRPLIIVSGDTRIDYPTHTLKAV